MKAVAFEQAPIVPTFEAYPVAFLRVGETDPLLPIDGELDDVRARKLWVASDGFVGLLGDWVAWGLSLVSLRSALCVATPARRIRMGGLYSLFCIEQTSALEYIPLVHEMDG